MLLATDSFPPICGGSGWSTYELARGLRARGTKVAIVQPRPGQARNATREHDGFLVEEIAAPAPSVPFVRNYFKNERLWRRLASHLRARLAEERFDVVHAQHVLTTVPAIRAAGDAAVPVVATVRDYWPVCYWSDLIHDYTTATLCPECTPANMRRCLHARAGALSPAAWPLIPYMRGNLARKRVALAGADAIVAVSSAIAADLRRRAPELASTTIVQIPNPVDIGAIRRAGEASRPLEGRYALFSGKLEPNKGAQHLLRVAREANLRWPLVVVGDGRLRPALEDEARHTGIDVRFTGWLPRDEALGYVRNAAMLIFPSHGPESLSRVLLEAGALGVAVAAMDTGGTRDIVRHEDTGLLSRDVPGLATDVARLAGDGALASHLGARLREHVETTFDSAAVVRRIELLYGDVISRRSAGAVRG